MNSHVSLVLIPTEWRAREVIADRGIWMKKRYILNVHNNEGVSTQNLNSR